MISKSILNNLKAGNAMKMEASVTDNLVARITLKPLETPKIKVAVYLATQAPAQRIADVAAMTATVQDYIAIETTVSNLISALVTRYKAKTTPLVAKMRRAEDFCGKVLDIQGIYNPDNYNCYTKKGWKKTTTEQAVSYFAHTFGRFYKIYGIDADEHDFAAFRASQVDTLYQRKYERSESVGEAKVKSRRDALYDSLNSRWKQAAIVQRYLFDCHPEVGWPETPIPITVSTCCARSEQVKSISYEQYVKVLAILARLCQKEIPYAYAGLLEAVCGARIGESCAPLIGEMQIDGNYGRYYIDHQINQYGERTEQLKNEASYRFVFFGAFLCDLVRLRVEQLKQAGYTEAEIASIPLASKHNTSMEHLKKTRVSTFLREVLELVGCDAAWLEAAAVTMFTNNFISGNADDIEICAHKLRAMLTTLLANGGVDANTVDAILGHESVNNSRKDYATWSAAIAIIHKIQRCINLGKLSSSKHVAETPIVVSDPSYFLLDGNNSYEFIPEQDMYMEVNIKSLEPGTALDLELPQAALDCLQQQSMPLKEGYYDTCPVLPVLPATETINQWVDEVNKMDLMNLIQKYGGDTGGDKN